MVKEETKILKELTPKSMVCAPMPVCPAIFETNKDSYVLIGKITNSKNLGISKRVGADETLIEIPKKLIDEMR